MRSNLPPVTRAAESESLDRSSRTAARRDGAGRPAERAGNSTCCDSSAQPSTARPSHDELVVSLNTVRTHTKHIYTKLGREQPPRRHRPGPPTRAALALRAALTHPAGSSPVASSPNRVLDADNGRNEPATLTAEHLRLGSRVSHRTARRTELSGGHSEYRPIPENLQVSDRRGECRCRPPSCGTWMAPLVDTEPYWIDVEFAGMAAKYGGRWRKEHALRGWSATTCSTRVATCASTVGIDLEPAEIVEELLDRVVVRMGEQGCRGGHGALELLAALGEAGVPCALVTMSYRRFVEPDARRAATGARSARSSPATRSAAASRTRSRT